jgi:hypothetical protein
MLKLNFFFLNTKKVLKNKELFTFRIEIISPTFDKKKAEIYFYYFFKKKKKIFNKLLLPFRDLTVSKLF